MSVVINRQGLFEARSQCVFTDVATSIQPNELDALLSLSAIRIVFESFADGRFLTLGRQLRLKGYVGHLRASGNMVPDQLPMALKVGFDSMEISDSHAQRCTEDQWRSQALRATDNYQTRVAG